MRAPAPTRLLGERLVARRALSPDALEAALLLQATHQVRLGELLVAEGLASEAEVWEELAAGWGTPSSDPSASAPDPGCASILAPAEARRLQVVPFKLTPDEVWIAAADPTNEEVRAGVTAPKGLSIRWFAAAPTVIRRAQLSLYQDAMVATAVTTLRDTQPDASAERQLSPRQRNLTLSMVALTVLVLIVWRGAALVAAMAVVTFAYAIWLAYRTRIVVRGARAGSGERVPAAEVEGLRDLPVYTVLCPIFREAGVVPELLRQLQALDYPRSKLDVKLLVEEDDRETRDRLAQLQVPHFCEVVAVPPGGPRTKPKACNYGLQLARGEYVVIFDAEDRPEPDQLKKALVVFRRHAGDEGAPLGCVQARLAYHNADQNWLTGWFALEYLSWFDFFLPGLVSLGLPVPLGGSSNHFPIAALRRVGSWDPFNVTEDADLGVRLHRAGYRTRIVDSVTWEEANSDFVNWTKQRSRWGKGYFVTWAVNMRHPLRLWRDLGARGWISVQLTLAGTYVTAVLNLLLWSLMAIWIFGQPAAVAALFPPEIYYLALLELLLGNFFFVYVTLWCATESGAFALTRLALTYPAYWVMMSVAMVKASFQLLTDHVYWEKTTHGLTPPPSAPGTGAGPPLEVVGRRKAVLAGTVGGPHRSGAPGAAGGSPPRRWPAQAITIVGLAALVAATWGSLGASGLAPQGHGGATVATASGPAPSHQGAWADPRRAGGHAAPRRTPRRLDDGGAGGSQGSVPRPAGSQPAPATPSPPLPGTPQLPLPGTPPLPVPSVPPLPLPTSSLLAGRLAAGGGLAILLALGSVTSA